jgi:hypothetical protein
VTEHTGRPKLDRAEALAYYLADPRRSFADVATAFGVTPQRVSQVAAEDGWRERRVAVQQAAVAAAEARALQSLEERNQETLEVADLALRKMAEQLRDPAFRLSGEGFVAIAKLALLIEGEPTDRIEVGEVQQFVRDLLFAVAEFVPRERRPALLESVDRVIEGVPRLRALPAPDGENSPDEGAS